MGAIHKYKGIPFFKLDSTTDLVCYLIQKELEGTKFVDELEKVGFDSSSYCPDLGCVIRALLGFQETSDELSEWYASLLYSYVRKMKVAGSASTASLALEMYGELCQPIEFRITTKPRNLLKRSGVFKGIIHYIYDQNVLSHFTGVHCLPATTEPKRPLKALQQPTSLIDDKYHWSSVLF